MRFCMITTFYPPFSYGGDATYVQALSRSLSALGHVVDVIASTDAYRLRSPMPKTATPDPEDGVTIHRLEHRFGSAASLIAQQTGHAGLYSRQIKQLLSEPYDVIHYHNISLVGGPAVLSMGSARIKLYSLHEHWLVCPTHIFWKNRSEACALRTCFTCSIRSGIPPQLWRYTSLRDRHLSKVDRLLAPSAYTAERHRHYGVTRPISVLPLFSAINLKNAPTLRAKNDSFVFVGRVTASKGIEQFARVAASMPEIDFIVIGEGDLRHSLAVRYAAHSNIRFLGHVAQTELIDYYSRATAIIMPSVAPETFGLAIVEAAACATPAIVAAASGGAAEIVSATGGGLLYIGDDELIGAINMLVADDTVRDRLGALARRGYENMYTRDHHLDAYLGEIDDIVRRRVI